MVVPNDRPCKISVINSKRLNSFIWSSRKFWVQNILLNLFSPVFATKLRYYLVQCVKPPPVIYLMYQLHRPTVNNGVPFFQTYLLSRNKMQFHVVLITGFVQVLKIHHRHSTQLFQVQ